ncbi:mucin-5AC-like [Anopheles maculipalpis]|uniref:mucin-5AC-like n=1 Tax=Anopheles maculipalpis TaxID=1496333 RepID=UPI002159714D|nr:mucin-5AC-like [Anopheles maculipalpis]
MPDESTQSRNDALSLTTLLSEDPTAAALQPGHTDASLQPLSEHNPSPSLPAAPGTDGRRRRRLGRKRKRRPLQDDYWPSAIPEDNDTESNGFSPSTATAGQVSDRKRLPYAGAAASRWEETAQKLTPGRQALRANGNHWMHNPYTDAINVDQPPATVRRLPGGQSSAAATAGNLSPIDPNRSRRIAGGRPTEQSPTNGKAYRKPYSQARRTVEEPYASGDGGSSEAGKVPTSATDLKALLKQSDGLSLSEILQQRNISLQDLIKGKQMALAALTQSPLEATTMATMGDELSTTLSPTLSSVRFRVHDDSSTVRPEASGDITSVTTSATTTMLPANDLLTTSGFNGGPLPSALEDESNNAVGDDIVHGGVGSIFPTVEIKQLALNPILPVHKEEQRVRPIKGVASRIRPDLSNTHIRTEPGQAAQVRQGIATTTTGSPTIVPTNPSSLLLMTSTTREKWTPSAALVGQRQKFQTTGTKHVHSGRYGYGTTLPSGFSSTGAESDSSAPLTLTTTLVGTTTEPPSAKRLIGLKLSSAEATSILPEAEAMVELSPDRHLHQHLLRVPKLKPRIAIKPKLTNVVPPTLPAETSSSSTVPPTSLPPTKAGTEKDRFNLSDVELGDDSTGEGSIPTSSSSSSSSSGKQGRQQRLNDDLDESDEPGLNIIEKFTSFADSAVPATQEERDSEQAAVADLIGRISEHTQRSFTDSLEDLYRDVTESNPSLFNDLSPIASADDRRELLELMEDRRIGSRLAKVLSQRNMTLEQLLEHRRRGSSQLHLAEIANGKVKPIDDKIDIVTAFEHFPRFNIGNLRSIRPDDIKLDSQGFSYFTSIINIRPSDEAYKEARALQDRHRPRRPSASANHRGETHFLVKGGSKDRLLVPSRMSAGTEHAYGSNSENYDHQADDPNVVGDLLDLELSGHGFQHHRSASVTIESTSMPVGVRSAIVASSAIVGVSLVIFIAIFVACRLRQRRRQKLNYTENFNMAKGRLPILHGSDQETTARKSCSPSVSGRSSSLGEQVVFTTHRALAGTTGSGTSGNGATGTSTTATGRQRAAMMDPNSVEVQDYLWDRKPFQ